LNTAKVKIDIKAADKAQTVTMQPGEMVEFSVADQSLIKKQVNPELYAAWRHHKMMFEQMTLEEIARELEDNYGVFIRIEDTTLANTYLTGAFPMQNLDMILASLPTIVDMEVVSNDNKIIFKPK
jgi:ferric-dicitrate binding protein FerR (iron transport regulator)